MLMRVLLDSGPDETNENFILVEVDEEDLGGAIELVADDAAGRDVVRAPETVARAFDRMVPALNTMLLKLRSADNAPDEIRMEFGLKFGGEAGLIFTKGTAEATFTVSIAWAKPAKAS
jgi:Trypsin-co-occurring domain 1